MRFARAPRGAIGDAYAIATSGERPLAWVFPTLRYRDPTTAIEWLCKAFGLTAAQVARDEDDDVVYAELVYGVSMVIIGPPAERELRKYLRQPSMARGATSALYMLVADTDEHFEQAKAAGADIIIEPRDQDYGGRDYTCRDIEGHIWSFGTYNPWKPPS